MSSRARRIGSCWPGHGGRQDRRPGPERGAVGACLHHVAPGVDTGNVLAEALPALSRWSNVLDATVGAIRLISTATVDFLKFVETADKSPTGTPQITAKGQPTARCP